MTLTIEQALNAQQRDTYGKALGTLKALIAPEAYDANLRKRAALLIQANDDVVKEYQRACADWPPFNSAHEAYGTLLEEVDELWDEVKVKQKNRDLMKMRKEAIQVSAMALRFIVDVCDEERGRA